MSLQLLQLCPNDHPPFDALTLRYQQAAQALGHSLKTVFLKPPVRSALPHASYAKDVKQIAADAVIAHRYRAMRHAVSARWRGPVLGIAHEFGLARTWQRRLWLKTAGRHLTLASVSDPVSQALTSQLDRSIVTLPNVLDVDAHQQRLLPRTEARAALNLPIDAHVVGVMGRLHWWKRPELAVEAFRIAARSGWVLAVLGDGEQEPVLRQLAADDPRVRVYGFRSDARRLLCAFDCMLLSSNEREAFNMVGLEAALAGVPVVSTPSPGPRTVLASSARFSADNSAAALADSLIQPLVAPDTAELRRRFDVPALSGALAEWLAKR